ncbi:MAG: NADH-quinone oxidoreductase subunit H [Deltaproteobacteria bacterium]|nr:NADH-quinone oxidoreductase subunit H [Deltaproteobacteria bacterium]
MQQFDYMKILYAFAAVFIVINYGLLLQGIVAKIYGRVSKKIGLRIYQPWLNLFRQYFMRNSIHHGVMYYLGPVFRLSGGTGILLFSPIIVGAPLFETFSYAGDMLLIMYFMFLGTLGMALGGGESGHPYAAMAVGRGLSLNTAAEIPIVMAIISVVAQYGTLDLAEIVRAQQGGIMHWTMVTNPLATAAVLLGFLGSMMRSPFDVVIAPQEIPIGPPTEYNSSFMALLMTNRTIYPIAKVMLFVTVFFGGVTLQDSWLLTFVIFFLKTFLLYMWSVFIGLSFPRFRVEQGVRWFFGVPALLGILSIAAVKFGWYQF